MAKKKRGRPYTGGADPIRTFRATDAEWARMKKAAAKAGKSFSAWAREILLSKANR